ncbi:hypothetical protein [Acinetobacter sp. ANC 3832]|uniref:hypothetical protein n=1 Tax=Acinetobacter sp. ANC 3832 TaxID=1977874 RepID=UPI000A35C01F|nr:hypothetical protein [Acinetobacter sp. ANC 3832]OTG87296.1 hypothetical protein B9T35_17615 [Acinetobacter sp. ANC 3832]
MTTEQDYPVQVQQIETGITVLKRRQKKLMFSSIGMSIIFIVSLFTLFVQQDIVLSLFGLSQQVEQLHLPYSIDANLRDFLDQPDYLLNLFSWFGWLVLKVIVAFTGAFIIVSILKKFRFFLIRFQSFVLKFVAWLVAFIILWSGLTYLQYDLKDDEAKQYQAFVHYDKNIQQSDIYQYLQRSNNPEPVQSYVLAQTALLHKPVDRDVAIAYVSKLVQSERTDPHFLEYGFKPEQIWSMQHQLYGKSVSPIAIGVESQVVKANRWAEISQFIVAGMVVLSFIVSLFLYLLASRLKKRLVRISQQLSY